VAKGQRVILDIALPPKNIDIPNVIGLNYFYAEAALHSHDFKWHVNLVLPTAPGLVQGQVVDEVPGPPALAPAGTRIALDVIRGTYTIAVPQVTGMTPAQADSAITGAGLTVGSSSNAHSPIVAQGLVISSSPAAGQKVPDGTAVHLLVSSGALVTVPFVVDETLQQAQQDLSSVGLQYLIIPIATSSPDQIGFVINQHPMSGQLVKPGFQVTLRVGVSNTSTTTTTTTTTTPTTPTS
jgi:beta-lactam-binding protein with PASTA domain